MEQNEMRELLSQASEVIEKENALEAIKESVVASAKAQMQFCAKIIESDDNLEDEEKRKLLRKLNIEAICLDINF